MRLALVSGTTGEGLRYPSGLSDRWPPEGCIALCASPAEVESVTRTTMTCLNSRTAAGSGILAAGNNASVMDVLGETLEPELTAWPASLGRGPPTPSGGLDWRVGHGEWGGQHLEISLCDGIGVIAAVPGSSCSWRVMLVSQGRCSVSQWILPSGSRTQFPL